MEVLLQARGFSVQRLLDGDATAANWQNALRDLLKVARTGDSLVVSSSSHGTWVRDLNGDEPDGKDECLCPVDFDFGDKRTWLTDDTLAQIVREANLPDCALTFQFDSCHAGTGLRDLPLSIIGNREHVTSFRQLSVPPAFLAEPIGWWRRMTPFLGGLRELRLGRGLEKAAGQARVGLLAATKPAQLAADAYLANDYHGAHTYAVKQVLRATPGLSLYGLRLAVNTWLCAQGFGGAQGQTPTLYGSKTLRLAPAFSG